MEAKAGVEDFHSCQVAITLPIRHGRGKLQKLLKYRRNTPNSKQSVSAIGEKNLIGIFMYM